MRFHNMLNKFAAFVTAVTVAATCAAPAFAADTQIDTTKKGSISVTMKTKEKVVSGGELTIYQVAKIQNDNGTYSYVYTNGFENCGVTLGDLTDSKLASKLEAKISSSAEKTTKTVGSDGTVKFENLSTGLYLCVQTKAASGYNKVSSFVVSVPLKEDGAWVYDVNASPKVETVTTPTTPNKPTTPDNGTLPKTGQLDWPIPILSVAGLLLCAFGWKMRKESTNEA